MNNADILFIPPVLNPFLKTNTEDFIPIGLLSLFSGITKAGFRGEIYKPQQVLVNEDDYSLIAGEILQKNPGVIGFSTWCHTFPNAILLANEIDRINPSVPILFGGPQVTSLARETMEKISSVDYVLMGEADFSLPMLLKYLLENDHTINLADIQGLVYRDKDNKNIIHQNSLYGFAEDLDKLPVPAYDMLVNKSNLHLDAGRGCPYVCTFCSTNQFFSRRFRMKSVNRILEEMDFCHQALDVNHIGFAHDTMTVDRRFINELCDRLIQRKANGASHYTWTCSSRADCLDKELIDRMYESGCRAIFIGMESGSPRIQKIIRKNLNLDKAHLVVGHAVKLGMKIYVSYIIGFPEESQDDMDLTLKSILEMTFAGAEAQVSLLSVLPGTQLYDEHLDKLEWDGSTFGMTGSFLSDPVARLVSNDPVLFSPYYYLPTDNITRKDLVFLSNLANLLSHFKPTLRLLHDYLVEDLKDQSLFDLFSKHMPRDQKDSPESYTELYFLSNMIKKYCRSLVSRGLELFILDVLEADITMAYMIFKNRKWQYTRAVREGMPVTSTEVTTEGEIKLIPVWKVISIKYDILHFITDPGRADPESVSGQGNFKLLIVPLPGADKGFFRLSDEVCRIINGLSEMKVSDYIKTLFNGDKEKALMYLSKFRDLGMIEIEVSKTA